VRGLVSGLNGLTDRLERLRETAADAAEREELAQSRQLEVERRLQDERTRREADRADFEKHGFRNCTSARRRWQRSKLNLPQPSSRLLRPQNRRSKSCWRSFVPPPKANLTHRPVAEGTEPLDELSAAVSAMFNRLSDMVRESKESAAQFHEGSRVVAQSADVLAEGLRSNHRLLRR